MTSPWEDGLFNLTVCVVCVQPDCVCSVRAIGLATLNYQMAATLANTRCQPSWPNTLHVNNKPGQQAGTKCLV